MKRFDSINVIPLIDVMLVLLAIVLTTASFIVKDSLNIELPETQSTQTYIPPADEKPVKFHIDRENQLYLNEQPQDMALLEGFLSQLDKQQNIVIQVDKNANFGRFVELIDALKKQQLNNLTILTKATAQ
ncbi:biopolymer transporter ExbD [Thiomicrorhabdus sp. ZW0627]|uniref:ExbD/TolR family protein n=1 Tax=Thiomicrorhabdus sp. ZW0627 TaxID=3039774 RepID=UPI002436AD9C|nr:biopolymer transporter ExbD [Thiomicrorhabdus sp. ZW0627]MDG6773471.1 biopolymer transporter ExbD [Thiomicrorhabdus sp. ZW0627]